MKLLLDLKKMLLFLMYFTTIYWSCQPALNENYAEKDNGFVQFDEIIHYKLKESDLDEYPPGSEDELYHSIIYEKYPETISDTAFISSLDSLDFVSNQVDQRNFKYIMEMEMHPLSTDIFKKCTPIYRDILVYKYKGQTRAFSKICFECNRDYNIGFSSQIKKVNNLINEGQYESLKDMINE